MRSEKWIALRLWQELGQTGLRSFLVDLVRDSPDDTWSDLRARAEERGYFLKDPFYELPADKVKAAVREYEQGSLKGRSFLTPADPLYPPSLLEAMDSPLSLTVQGRPEVLHEPALAVVGSREPSRDTLFWMESELGTFCREQRVVIVSGGARGVDQKAHSLALRNRTPTVVFLPSGLDNLYPQDLSEWTEAILEGGGALVSEYPASLRMAKQNFHQRNRLIAGLSKATLIVEAKRRSGTVITAMRAAEIGRPLWVVPGHPQSPHFGGSLDLLAEGGSLIRQHEDLTLFWQAENFCSRGAQLSLGALEGIAP